jgi:cystathionine beta-lyase/cystathionine gamma-synthase
MDIPAIARAAHAVGAKVVVDNTFATPYCARPLQLGADVVVESATKFLAGHSDVVAGAVTTDDVTLHEDVLRRLITFGGCLDPHAAFLVWRGLRTFRVRMAESCRTAAVLADDMAKQVDVARVVYPGRYDHPDVASGTVSRVMPDAFGAMLTLVLDGGDERALKVLRALRVGVEATSLGGVETLASTPFNSSHFSLTPQERIDAGIVPGMLRLAIGLEGEDALGADLRDALAATR